MNGMNDINDTNAPPADRPAHGVEPTRRGGMSTRQWWSLALIVPVVLIGAFVAAREFGGGDDGPSVGMRITEAAGVEDVDWFYRIPVGTADRIAAGEAVEIVPAELVVQLGDTIRIVNDDSSAHIVGVFFVGAGEPVTQQFQSVGVLEGDCSVHPSGSFSLRVIDA